MSRLLPFLLLVSCSGEATYVCPGVRAFAEFASESPPNCGKIRNNVELAFDMLAVAGVVSVTKEHLYNRLSVLQEDTHTIKGHEGWAGYYDGFTIYLSGPGESLVHEMLHHWELSHGGLDTFDHPHWCEKGWGAAREGDCPGSLSDVYAGLLENEK